MPGAPRIVVGNGTARAGCITDRLISVANSRSARVVYYVL